MLRLQLRPLGATLPTGVRPAVLRTPENDVTQVEQATVSQRLVSLDLDDTPLEPHYYDATERLEEGEWESGRPERRPLETMMMDV